MKEFILRSLLRAAGIEIDGKNAWDMQVHDERVFGEILKRGSLGLGEAYLDGWWDCAALEEFFRRILRAKIDRVGLYPFYTWGSLGQ